MMFNFFKAPMAEDREQKWQAVWDEKHGEVSAYLDWYCRQYNINKVLNDEAKATTIHYITAIMVLEKYGKPAFTNHGTEVNHALRNHLSTKRDNSKRNIEQLITDLQEKREQYGNTAIDPAGFFCAILSIIEDECQLTILDRNSYTISFNQNAPQGHQSFGAFNM